MKKIQTFILSLLLTLIVWSCFSWPLAPNIGKGMPSSFSNEEKNHTRAMIHGDHLQFMYHLWLLSDTINKNAPLFNNVYEFNEGEDSANKKIQFYYFPFSFIFTVFFTFFTRAAAYNLTGIFSLFLTFYFTYLLTKRFTASKTNATVIALIAICFPYRWATLLGGSPTGLAMLWVPMLVLGIDKAVRDNSFLGGTLAGTALLFSFFTDTHVFYFAALSVPAWYLFSLTNKKKFEPKNIYHWFKLINGTMPIVFLGLLSVSLIFITKKDLSGSIMAGGRTWREVELYSPFWKGLFSISDLGPHNHVYLGLALLGMLALGFLFFIITTLYSHKKHKKLSLFNFIFLYLGIFIIASLALGTNGPFMAKLFQAARKLLPHYDMIRQPSKILCLMPTISALAVAFSLNHIFYIVKDKLSQKILISLFAVFMITEYRLQISPSVCLTTEQQKAYSAVKIDSINNNTRAHILGITLWPGDSAFTSVYEYYASLYNIRMINGYHPVVGKNYFQNVFRFFESINTGFMTETQKTSLLEKNINYIILHEDLYPEKVSAFPVTFALKNLLIDDNLSLLKQDGPVWSFKINNNIEDGNIYQNTKSNKLSHLNTFFPARNFEFEHCREDIKALIEKDPTANNGKFLRLKKRDTSTIPKFYTSPAPSSRFMLRLKGEGTLTAKIIHEGQTTAEIKMEVNDAKNWQWKSVRLTNHTKYEPVQLKIECTEGTIDADMALFTAGVWEGHRTYTKKTSIPAPLFFHAGYIDLKKDTVEIKKDKVHAPNINLSLDNIKKLRVNEKACFYGPILPLTQGNYNLNFDHTTNAKKGTILGSIHIRCGNQIVFFSPVYAGMPMPNEFYIPYNKPVTLDFIYAGNADISIKKIEFIKDADEKK